MPDVLTEEKEATQKVTGEPEPYVRLVNFLKVEGPTKRAEIARVLGCSIRRVKRMAEAARFGGIPIGYSTDNKSGGIYLCETQDQIRKVMRRLENLALTLLDERKQLRKCLDKMISENQGRMF